VTLREPPFLSFGSCFPRRAGGSQSTTFNLII